MALSWFQKNFGFKPPSTDSEFLLNSGAKIVNTVSASDQITKKSFEVKNGSGGYDPVWEIVYTYNGTDTNPLTSIGQEPTT